MKFEICAATDKGKIRKNNEDNYFINSDFLSFSQANEGTGSAVTLSAPFTAGVSDGMGGEKNGENASLITVSSFSRYFTSTCKPSAHRLTEAVRAINKTICSICPGSGATLAAVCAGEDGLCAVTIGDSRIYLYSGGILQLISTDHTLAQLHVDAGMLTREEAVTSSLRHSLTQHLGIPEKEMQIEPDIIEIEGFTKGDILLLCSDGLYDTVTGSEILCILEEDCSSELKNKKLIEAALERGGPDNITSMLLSCI